MKIKIDKPQYPKNRHPWRVCLTDKDRLGDYSIFVGYFDTHAEALFRGRVAFKFLTTNSQIYSGPYAS